MLPGNRQGRELTWPVGEWRRQWDRAESEGCRRGSGEEAELLFGVKGRVNSRDDSWKELRSTSDDDSCFHHALDSLTQHNTPLRRHQKHAWTSSLLRVCRGASAPVPSLSQAVHPHNHKESDDDDDDDAAPSYPAHPY